MHNIDDDPHLSFIVGWEYDNSKKGHGAIVSSNYEVEKEVQALSDVHDFNMHEFNIMDGGKTALACTYRPQVISLTDFGRPTEESWVTVGGFVEVDVETSEVLVQWDSFDHIALNESNMFHAWDNPAGGSPGWDYVHINAVDKNKAGDYLISLRFTDTIYLISSKDGNIVWRLGGLESDFEQDFTFSKQHDVKFVSSDGTRHVISFLNNASDERGYSSEHASNGDLLMTAQFASDRYSTYRSYKGEFTGRPTAPPDLVASVYGTHAEDMTTIIHVSWNGATDVVQWKFYAQAYDRSPPVLIGTTNKTDFETMFIADGYMDFVSAEAIDAEGNVMHTSETKRTGIPPNWKAAGWAGADSGPTPDDPSIIVAANDNTESTPSAGSTGDKAVESVNNGTSTGSGDRSTAQYADAKEVAKAVYKAYEVIRAIGALLVFILVASTLGGAGFALWRHISARRSARYQHVPSEEGLPVEQIPLASNQQP